MENLCYDIECTHYEFDKIHKIHCIAIGDLETGRTSLYVTEGEQQEAVQRLQKAKDIVAHNGIRFDDKVMEMFFPGCGIKTTRDTLVMSRLAKPKWRMHSLDSWGKVLRFKKGTYAADFKAAAGDSYVPSQEWQEYNEDMGQYCIQDVRVNIAVYNKLLQDVGQMFTWENLELEQYILDLMETQKNTGVGFNVQKAEELFYTLKDRRDELDITIKRNFDGFHKRTPVFTPKRDNKSRGYIKGSSMCKLEWQPFNPSSRDHIEFYFKKEYKWEPEELTDSGKAKLSETILKSLATRFPEAGPLAERFMIDKRLGMLSEGRNAWLKLQQNGRIHGSVNPMGTVTSRATHSSPNLAQIPSAQLDDDGKLLWGAEGNYGADCRDLFGPHKKGFIQVGCDMSGIEARLLGHYCQRFDGGALNDVILNGDIHSHNQKLAGLATRAEAKTFFYALMYGAGDAHIGNMLGGTRFTGSKARATFMKNMPAYTTLLSRIKAFRKQNRKHIKAIDGRMIPVDNEHTSLNYLLQSAGAILSKEWIRQFHRLCKEAGYILGKDYYQMLWIHDEVQLAVREDIADAIGKLCVKAIEIAGELHKLKIPITGEYDKGTTWAECH